MKGDADKKEEPKKKMTVGQLIKKVQLQNKDQIVQNAA